MRLKRKWLFGLAPFIMAAFVFAIGELVMSLWNWIAAGIFGLPHLTFWQAWGLLLLCRILFGSLHGGGSHKRDGRGRLSPEERERLRENLRTRWGCDAAPSGSGEPA